jgi:hypothetical protein
MYVTQNNGDIIYMTSTLKPEDIVIPTVAKPVFPHLCLLKQWVYDCEETHEPHRRWEFRFNSGTEWLQCTDTTAMFIKGWSYRKKVPKVYINGADVLLGVATIAEIRAELKVNTTLRLYIVDTNRNELYVEFTPYDLFNFSRHEHLLEYRLVYFNKEDAINRAKAMLSWTNNK